MTLKSDFTVKDRYRHVGESDRVDRVVIEVYLTHEAETAEEIAELTELAESLQKNPGVKVRAEMFMQSGNETAEARPFRIH